MISTRKSKYSFKSTEFFQIGDIIIMPVLTWEEFTDEEKDSIMESFTVVLSAGVINCFVK